MTSSQRLFWTATTAATFESQITYDPKNVQNIVVCDKYFQINPADGTANAAAGDTSKVSFSGDGTESFPPWTVKRSDSWTDEYLTAAIADKFKTTGVTVAN